MCVENPSERSPRRSVALVIKLIIFFAVLGFALAVLLIGVEAVAAGAFVAAIVAVGMKAGSWSAGDDPGGSAEAVSNAPA
jgi:hypothetical protein